MKLLQPAITALRSGELVQMAKFEDLLPTDVQLEEMMKMDVVVISDRVSVLRRKQQALYESARVPGGAASPPQSPTQQDVNPTDQCLPLEAVQPSNRRNVQEVMKLPSQRPIPLSAKLADHPDPLSLLRDSQWILEDPFEFVPAYRAA